METVNGWMVVLVGWLFVANILLFLLMWFDKNQARKRKQRIPEKTLLLLAFLGGPVGGIAGMNIFRHKTKHDYFSLLYILSLVFWIGIIFIITK